MRFLANCLTAYYGKSINVCASLIVCAAYVNAKLSYLKERKLRFKTFIAEPRLNLQQCDGCDHRRPAVAVLLQVYTGWLKKVSCCTVITAYFF